MTKKTILAFPFALLLGSTHPIVAVGKELIRDGHRVIFASSGKYLDYINQEGFETIEIPDLDMEWFTKYTNNSSMGYHNFHTLEKFVDAEVKLIKKIKPDLLLTIHRPSLKVASKITGVKLVSLVDVIFTSKYSGKISMPETHVIGFINNKIFPKELNQSITQIARKFYFQKWIIPYNKLLKKHGHKAINSFGELFEGDMTIFMDASEFSGKLKDNKKSSNSFHFVGPVLHTLANKEPDWLKSFDKKKKTIFLSMGSSGVKFNEVLEYLHKIFYDDDRYQIVATTALNHKLPDLKYPKHFFLTDYVPADLILKHNCVLSIVHGGRGSIYHALKHGVPIIGIPHQAEQQWNLQKAEELGLGKMIFSKKLNFHTFKESVDQIIHKIDDYKYNAVSFSKCLQKYRGEFHAAELINDFLNGHSVQPEFNLSLESHDSNHFRKFSTAYYN